MLQPQTGLFHESWAALLLALMVAIRRPENPWPAIFVGGLALMIRELTLPMILAMGGLALLEKRWREAAGWALIVVLFGIYMTLHAQWVSQVVLPDDPPSPKQKWIHLQSANFSLYASAPERTARRLVTRLERLRQVLAMNGKGRSLELTRPTEIFVFRDQRAFQPFEPIGPDGKPQPLGGYFIAHGDRNVIDQAQIDELMQL